MFENFCPNDLLILANVIAIALSEGRDADELNVLGNFIVSIGSLMLTAAAQMELLSSKQEAKNAAVNDASDEECFDDPE